jgi:uncharacterized protein YkwD
MTFAMIPTAAVLALTINSQVPDPQPGSIDAAPDRVQIHVEEVECVTLPSPPTTRLPRTIPRTAFLTSGESKVMRLLNAMRRRLGMRTLALDKVATLVARNHSRDMCRRRYFAHKNPDGKMPWDRLKAGGVKFRGAGENIAAGQRTALEVHKDWNNSPGHRRNRLNKHYRRMGIGVYWCAGVPYWTEVFMH